MDTLILAGLLLGIYITWGTEALGAVIRKASITIGRNLLGASIVQSIGVLSRFGFFLQSFAIAWIIDENRFPSSRLFLIGGYLATVLLALLSTQSIGPALVKNAYRSGVRLSKDAEAAAKIDGITGMSTKHQPSYLQITGYVFLYFGGIFPLVAQLIAPSFAARGLALASIINGVSTIILIAIIDMRMAMEIEKTGTSMVPDQLFMARYYGLLVNTAIFLACISLT